jgi:nicotinamidase-related amidase
MTAKLLIIDPQNDFCDIPRAALPVPGADADMHRLAALMDKAGAQLSDLIVTLDSHASVGIERTSFWLTQASEPVAPFTQITERQVRDGLYRPRDPSLTPEVLAYLHDLERGGRYRLVVWPVHCVLGTWGHNLHERIAAEIAKWEQRTQRPAHRVLKGLNPMTEQYSAIQAEVRIENDPLTHANRQLIERARPDGGGLLVAGEAASHCVAATMEHLFAEISAEQRRNVIILRDCMSPVTGFESQAQAFFERCLAYGARVTTSGEALEALR